MSRGAIRNPGAGAGVRWGPRGAAPGTGAGRARGGEDEGHTVRPGRSTKRGGRANARGHRRQSRRRFPTLSLPRHRCGSPTTSKRSRASGCPSTPARRPSLRGSRSWWPPVSTASRASGPRPTARWRTGSQIRGARIWGKIHVAAGKTGVDRRGRESLPARRFSLTVELWLELGEGTSPFRCAISFPVVARNGGVGAPSFGGGSQRF